ncbi:hypothetical protein Tco_0053838 [Tanacetum coccineum]
MGWPTIGGEGDGESNWTSSGVIGERVKSNDVMVSCFGYVVQPLREEVSLVDACLGGCIRSIGVDVEVLWAMEFLCHHRLNQQTIVLVE